jgi:hypothetical protein
MKAVAMMRMTKVSESPIAALYAKGSCKVCHGSGTAGYLNRQPLACKCLMKAMKKAKDEKNAGQ